MAFCIDCKYFRSTGDSGFHAECEKNWTKTRGAAIGLIIDTKYSDYQEPELKNRNGKCKDFQKGSFFRRLWSRIRSIL